jgi:uncharacterized membrane protein/mono/diheme cytochrome c family protein
MTLKHSNLIKIGLTILIILNSASSFAFDFSNVKNLFLDVSNFEFFGRFHVLLVHFPIAIWLFALGLEVFTFKNFNSKYRETINIAVYISCVSTVLSAIFGYVLSENQEITGQIFDLHYWGGIATSLLGLMTTGFLYFITKNNQTRKVLIYRSLLLLTCLGVIFTGHQGGSLTHGEDFLSFNKQETSSENQGILAQNFSPDSLDPANQLKLLGQVRAIFAHNCYKCHSSNKQEGKLRLDQKEFVFLGGKHGEIINLKNPEKSELLRRITLPRSNKEAMPTKGKGLKPEEIELLKFWLEKGSPWPDGALQPTLFKSAKMEPRKPALPIAADGLKNPIDIWVNEYFKQNNLTWKKEISDYIFLKRVYLDIVGLLPSPEEAKIFENDPSPIKREVLIKKLLNQQEDYTQHWLTFWNDILRNDYTGTGYITKGRYNINEWLYTSIKENKPYNQFVTELLSPNEKSKGFIEGIKWRGTINSSQSVEMQAAQNVGQVIFGLNLKCASCHDSFISDWKLDDAYAFANIFSEERLEINRCDKPTGKFADTRLLWQNFGNIDSSMSKAKKMEKMAQLLVTPANGRMYRTIVNRIWKQMMGRGIIESPDEMDNEPWSQDLLDWLAFNFVEKNYDIKSLIYLIATSKIYQSPSENILNPNKLFDQNYVFKGMARKRLTAEQFSDAVSQVITPLYEIKDLKFENFPKRNSQPSFVRSSLVANNPFLTALGRPNREVVVTSRDSQASLLQALELTNGERLIKVLERGASEWKLKFKTRKNISNELYLRLLGRIPNEKELKVIGTYMDESPSNDQIQDLFWAVLLLPEFQIIY